MLDTKLFERLFARPTGIRVRMNWEAVRANQWPVEGRVVDSLDQLERSYFPWYLSQNKREVTYIAHDAVPIAVRDLEKATPYLSEGRREKIDGICRSFTELGGEIQLLIPGYALNSGERLILDACHRLAALAKTRLPFVGLLLELHGPPDPAVLPDLGHWAAS